MQGLKNLYSILLFICSLISAQNPLLPRSITYNADYQWAIIGAGPAGIMVLGVLLDLGTDPKDILWVDPEFNVGRMGHYYANVPSNTKTKHFIECLNSCQTFLDAQSPALEKLYDLNPELEYPLKVIVEPLQEVTDYLRTLIKSDTARLCSLSFEKNVWRVGTTDACFTAAHVILATGSHPKKPDYNCVNEIPLDIALDKELLAAEVTIDDTIAVVGSGQSAILLLKHLSELAVGRMINFYLHPINFNHPETGLKGSTARWARDILLKTPPTNLIRMINSCEVLKAWLPICTKIIYAVGFERNELPPIAHAPYINFDDRNGIIGPRLFGIGIAFPEKYEDEKGKLVSKIGLLNFMEYAHAMVPTWLHTKAPLTRYKAFEDIIMIELL